MKTRSKTYSDDIPTPPLDSHFMTKKKSTAAEIIEDVVSKLNEESQPDASKSPIDEDPGGTLQAQSERTTEDVEVTNDVTLSSVGAKDSNIVPADSKNDNKPQSKSKSTSNSNHNDNQSINLPCIGR